MNSLSRQKLRSILPHITGSLSWLGSLSIIIDIIRKYRNNNNNHKSITTYHRLMLGMSLFDLCMGTNQMLNTLVMPADTPNVYGCFGTEASCIAFGFLGQLGIGSPFYNLMLSIYYYLVIVKNSSPSATIEKCMHFVCISFAFGTAITALALGMLGYAGFWCWITAEHGKARLWFWYVPVLSIMLAMAMIMTVIYCSLAKQEDRQRNFRFRGRESLAIEQENRNDGVRGALHNLRRNRRSAGASRSVKWQAFRYVGSFFAAWFFLAVTRFMVWAGRKPPFALVLASVILSTSQGLLNFWIYIRPRYVEHKKRHPDVGRFVAFFRVNPLFSGCECCHKCCHRGGTKLRRRMSIIERRLRVVNESIVDTDGNIPTQNMNDYNSQAEVIESEHNIADVDGAINGEAVSGESDIL